MHGGKNVKFKQFQFLKNEAIKKLTALEEEPLRLRNRTIEECLSADAVMLAYIGDAVYHVCTRTSSANEYHKGTGIAYNCY